MTTASPTNLQRLLQCEEDIKDLRELVRIQSHLIREQKKSLDTLCPLAAWAIKEITAEQESRLATDKRLGIR